MLSIWAVGEVHPLFPRGSVTLSFLAIWVPVASAVDPRGKELDSDKRLRHLRCSSIAS